MVIFRTVTFRSTNSDQKYVFHGPILLLTLELKARKINEETKPYFFLKFGGFGNESRYLNRIFSHYNYIAPSGHINYPGNEKNYRNNEIATFVINPVQTITMPGFLYAANMEKNNACGDSLTVFRVIPEKISRYGHLRYNYR